LKAAIPSLDAIDLDDENNFDESSTVAFAMMLHGLGYHVMPDAFSNSSYWTSVVSEINSQSPGTVDVFTYRHMPAGQGTVRVQAGTSVLFLYFQVCGIRMTHPVKCKRR
jgi:hypothetical protein